MTTKKRLEQTRLKLKLDKELQELYAEQAEIQKCVFDHIDIGKYTNTDLDYNQVLINRRLKELGWVK